MNKSPAFQFYPKDFLADINVSIMSMEERGVYITLLCHLWNEGKLPSNSRVLQRLCNYPQDEKWGEIWATVGRCFYVKRGKLFHRRLDKERIKQTEWREKSSLGGQISAQKRWGTTSNKSKGGVTKVTRVVQPKGNSSSSSSDCTKSVSKDTRSNFKFLAEHLSLAKLLESGIKERLPRHNLSGNYIDNWANTFRIMEEKKEATIAEMEFLLKWVFNHDFWYKNILSADKFKKQFGRLAAEAQEDKDKGKDPDWDIGKQQQSSTPQYTPEEEELLPQLEDDYAEQLEQAKEKHGWKTDDDIDPFKVPSKDEYIKSRLKEIRKQAKKGGSTKCPVCRSIVLNGDSCQNCGEGL